MDSPCGAFWIFLLLGVGGISKCTPPPPPVLGFLMVNSFCQCELTLSFSQRKTNQIELDRRWGLKKIVCLSGTTLKIGSARFLRLWHPSFSKTTSPSFMCWILLSFLTQRNRFWRDSGSCREREKLSKIVLKTEAS